MTSKWNMDERDEVGCVGSARRMSRLISQSCKQKGLPQEPFLTQHNDPARGRYAADSSSVG
ncbi:hypothetical protein PEP31012_00660 [Pandoraea eparura]|uniref:Uncharacterized protein n=1 Tax=Pandoraea eparura TaxID=2508291 RepID=A0A5E4SDH0_9BURK|nr:hypothetical protein PEP31012_00660 [Pandoraea eparura]